LESLKTESLKVKRSGLFII